MTVARFHYAVGFIKWRQTDDPFQGLIERILPIHNYY